MTGFYNQTVDIEEPKYGRVCLIVGGALKLISFGFILLAAFVSAYFLFGLVVLFAAGSLLTQLYNKSPMQFEYDYNDSRLVICRRDRINRRTRVCEVLIDDIIEFGLFCDVFDEECDSLFCSSAHAEGVYYLTAARNNVAFQSKNLNKRQVENVKTAEDNQSFGGRSAERKPSADNTQSDDNNGNRIEKCNGFSQSGCKDALASCGGEVRLLLTPDEYMIALLDERLSEKQKKGVALSAQTDEIWKN